VTKAEVSFLGPVEVRDLAAQLDIVPTKKLGQNFVHDANTVRRIVAAADLPEDSYPVEVGPGLGSLTLGLLEHCGRAAAVEIDPRLAERLPQTVAERAEGCELELIEKDALKVSREDFQTSPDALVANFPYNVSVPVLLHMLAELPTIRRVLVMVQSEVADRLAAPARAPRFTASPASRPPTTAQCVAPVPLVRTSFGRSRRLIPGSFALTATPAPTLLRTPMPPMPPRLRGRFRRNFARAFSRLSTLLCATPQDPPCGPIGDLRIWCRSRRSAYGSGD